MLHTHTEWKRDRWPIMPFWLLHLSSRHFYFTHLHVVNTMYHNAMFWWQKLWTDNKKWQHLLNLIHFFCVCVEMVCRRLICIANQGVFVRFFLLPLLRMHRYTLCNFDPLYALVPAATLPTIEFFFMISTCDYYFTISSGLFNKKIENTNHFRRFHRHTYAPIINSLNVSEEIAKLIEKNYSFGQLFSIRMQSTVIKVLETEIWQLQMMAHQKLKSCENRYHTGSINVWCCVGDGGRGTRARPTQTLSKYRTNRHDLIVENRYRAQNTF